MNALLVVSVFVLSVLALAAKGPRFAFNWVYIPVFALVPARAVVALEGVPDLNARRAAALAVILGVLAAGGGGALRRHVRWWDGLVVAAILSFSVSYGMNTDLMGTVHRLAVLTLDWGVPYLLVRLLLRGRRGIGDMLLPLTLATFVLAALSVYEARMASRVSINLWNSLGLGVDPPPHFQGWRGGFLRASATFYHPITLGTYFAAVTPLMLLWGRIAGTSRWVRWVAVMGSVAGCVAALSRGPWGALAVTGVLFFLLAVRAKRLAFAGAVLVLAALPVVLEVMGEHLAEIQRLLAFTGNTPRRSGYYRIALLLMYGKALGQVGWLGKPSIIGAEYEEAWSLDNAFLYLFIVGGWLGGGLVLAFVGTCLVRALRGILVARGPERVVRCCIAAAFGGVAGCMLNVWFAPDYAPLLWIMGGLVLNQIPLRPSARRPTPNALHELARGPTIAGRRRVKGGMNR